MVFPGGGGGAFVERQTLLDLKVKEKKTDMAELRGEPQNHLEGVGVVIPNQVSLSDNDEDHDGDTAQPYQSLCGYTKSRTRQEP